MIELKTGRARDGFSSHLCIRKWPTSVKYNIVSVACPTTIPVYNNALPDNYGLMPYAVENHTY